jgi:methionine synthase II (cobalamin-independent)
MWVENAALATGRVERKLAAAQHGEFGAGRGIRQPGCVVVGGGQRARSGGFEPLRFVPRGNERVVLGLVTSKRAALESKDELKRRFDEAAKYVPLDQLCLSPQCGFSSTVDGNALTIEEEKAKLRLVVETGREVWG